MNHLKRFSLFESTNWSGTIRIDSSTPSDIMKYWTRNAHMPVRFFNYIKESIKLDLNVGRCRLIDEDLLVLKSYNKINVHS